MGADVKEKACTRMDFCAAARALAMAIVVPWGGLKWRVMAGITLQVSTAKRGTTATASHWRADSMAQRRVSRWL